LKILPVPITKYMDNKLTLIDDPVSVEEPLEIFVNGEPYYLTMRTPGEEMLLAAGLCFTEGVINSVDDLLSISYCGDESGNRVQVYAKNGGGSRPARAKAKQGATYSSCGICGKELVEDICTSLARRERTTTIAVRRLTALQQSFRNIQEIFPATGGTHGAGLFTVAGDLLAFSEDVGRHNALDKAIGRVLFDRQADRARICLLSSRLSYEMVQKACRLQVEILAGASSATSLAVDLAKSLDLTLIGFLREHRANVYSCPERIFFDPV
jgi:FdhD protein